MGGGDSHQRAMERAAKARIDKQISAALDRALSERNSISNSEEPIKMPEKAIPWYERGLFWGCISLAAAIVLTVIAATQKDLRWLLFISWPFFVLPFWLMCREISRVRFRWILFLGLSGLAGIGLFAIGRIVPKPRPNSAITVLGARLPRPFAADLPAYIFLTIKNLRDDETEITGDSAFDLKEVPQTAEGQRSLEDSLFDRMIAETTGERSQNKFEIPGGGRVDVPFTGPLLSPATVSRFQQPDDRLALYITGVIRPTDGTLPTAFCFFTKGQGIAGCHRHNGVLRGNDAH
jgi:hypothetical protein